MPEAHYLESWGDVRGFDGTVSFVQPLIAPLYGGKSAHEVIATLAGQPDKTSHDVVQEYWQTQNNGSDFDIFWQKALHDGVVPNTARAAANVTAKAPPAAPAATGARNGDHVPARSHHLGWIVRQQRLAAGAAQAPEQDDLGQRRLDQPHHGDAASTSSPRTWWS